MSGGTLGETERSRGAFLVGASVVKLFGGGDGSARNCFWFSARFTQKWIVVLGRRGLRESPRIARDQPASQRERRRDSISGRERESRKLTSSCGSRIFVAMLPSYRVSEGAYGARGPKALDGRDEKMNLYFFRLLPVSALRLYLTFFENVS